MGTSIGAVNGAFVAQGDFDKCYTVWQTVTPSMLFDENYQNAKEEAAKHDKSSILSYFRLAKYIISNRGIPIDKAKELLFHYIDEDKLRASPVDFGVVTVSVTDRWTPVEIFKEEMPPGTIAEYVLASAYFPAFENTPLNGKHYIDGGIYDNLPINPLIRKGYGEIIAIRTGSKMPHKKVVDKSVKIGYISPSQPLGKTLSFSRESLQDNMDMGYFDALRFTDGLKGKKYYINPMDDGAFIFRFSYMHDTSMFQKIGAMLGVSGSKEEITCAFADYINRETEETFSVFEAFIVWLEYFAEQYGIERYRAYGFSQLTALLKEKYNERGRIVAGRIADKLKEAFYILLEYTHHQP
jgi:NTE family protein